MITQTLLIGLGLIMPTHSFANEPASCESFEQSIRSFDVNQLSRTSHESVTIPVSADCPGADAATEALQERYSATCSALGPVAAPPSEQNREDWRSEYRPCMDSIYLYQAHLLSQAPSRSINGASSKELKQRLLGYVHTFEKGQSLNGQKLTQTADQLARTEGSEDALILASQLRLMTVMEMKAQATPRDWRQARLAIQRAQRANPSDERVHEMAIVSDSRGLRLAPRIKSRANALLTEFPNSAVAHYYLAYSAWTERDRAQAISHLQSAIEQRAEPRFQRSLERVRDADFDQKGLFEMNIAVRISSRGDE